MGMFISVAGLDQMAHAFHADNQYRDSFVYDVMEPIRPEVDSWLLNFIQNHTFSPKDFYGKNMVGSGSHLSLHLFSQKPFHYGLKRLNQ